MRKQTKVVLATFILAAAALMLGAWTLIRRGFSARENPSGIERVIARTARNLATPARAKQLQNPQPMTFENIREGLEHFADHCAICHANNGNGNTVFGRNMYPKPPDLRADQTQRLSDGEIYFIIQNGVRLTGMPAFGEPNQTDNKDSWNLVHFIRHLPKLTPDEEAEMARFNPKSPAEWQEQQEIEQFLSGEEQPTPSRRKPHKH
jgi:mono/diheme cytochrome c family protein